MKILYAVQATGNGHISRASEIIPHLQQHGQVDVFMSGSNSNINPPFNIVHKKNGLSFYAGKSGGIDLLTTFRKVKLLRLVKDIAQCNLKQYDLIINDFEPITAWSCKLRKIPFINMSHQGAFLSNKSPRPPRMSIVSEYVLKYYAPAKNIVGFHFDSYDSFIHTPIIRTDIRNAKVSNQGHIAVYLPAYSEMKLVGLFSQIKCVNWKIFSKNIPPSINCKNVEVHGINNLEWVNAVASAEGVLIGAGFEGPSEALYLGKKLMVMPMQKQYEQLCNAIALAQMGVRTSSGITKKSATEILDWIKNDNPVKVNYNDHTAQIVRSVVSQA